MSHLSHLSYLFYFSYFHCSTVINRFSDAITHRCARLALICLVQKQKCCGTSWVVSTTSSDRRLKLNFAPATSNSISPISILTVGHDVPFRKPATTSFCCR